MLRGRIRKLSIENSFNVLAENAEDKDNVVRFATLNTQDAELITIYIGSIISDSLVVLVDTSVVNPVLSKLKVNDADRYSL